MPKKIVVSIKTTSGSREGRNYYDDEEVFYGFKYNWTHAAKGQERNGAGGACQFGPAHLFDVMVSLVTNRTEQAKVKSGFVSGS